MPAIAIAIVGSTLVGVLLVGALVAAMGRVVSFVDAHYGSPRTPAKPSATPKRPDGPEWWPRFERQFAEYVDQLGERRV
jgi:hypothetical protein